MYSPKHNNVISYCNETDFSWDISNLMALVRRRGFFLKNDKKFEWKMFNGGRMQRFQINNGLKFWNNNVVLQRFIEKRRETNIYWRINRKRGIFSIERFFDMDMSCSCGWMLWSFRKFVWHQNRYHDDVVNDTFA